MIEGVAKSKASKRFAEHPVGSVAPVFDNLGSSLPSSGQVSKGWMRSDGATVPAGEVIAGNQTADLTGDTFLADGAASLTKSGSNTASYAASLGGSESFGHRHNIKHVHQWGTITQHTNFDGDMYKVAHSKSGGGKEHTSSISSSDPDRVVEYADYGKGTGRHAPQIRHDGDWYSSGVRNGNSGSGSGADTNYVTPTIGFSNFGFTPQDEDNRPAFLRCVYLMRVS